MAEDRIPCRQSHELPSSWSREHLCRVHRLLRLPTRYHYLTSIGPIKLVAEVHANPRHTLTVIF